MHKFFILGLLVGLATLTRFEGYLLFLSFGLYFGLNYSKNISILVKNVTVYCLAFLLVQMPWFIRKYLVFGSVLGSPYFSEPEGFGYDLNMTLIFIGSLLFSLGICSAVYFIFRGGVVLKNELKLHSLPIFLFILFELALIFLWPAAIPRLFFPLLPLFHFFYYLYLPFFLLPQLL